ncbi:alpha/beta fold hydrolase [Kineococcus xinjiangensis]|nr:alpha/beta hydrolase [Kineococcus xinjiangensis]
MSQITSFDGTRLAVQSRGPEAAPVVVLVHGLGLSADSWRRVAGPLSGGHRVVAYDLRGHGRSAPASGGDYSMRAHALDLDAVLREVVPEGRDAVLVGNSLGGGVIVARAHHCGTRGMAGVVFAGSGASGVTVPGLPARRLPDRVEAAVRTAWLKALLLVARAGRHLRPVESVSDRIVRRCAFTSHAPRDLVAEVRDDFLRTRPQALAGTTLASVSHDGRRMAPDLAVPALVLHGSRDPEVPRREVRELLADLPDAEFVTLRGEGHMLPLTDPHVVESHVERWVARVQPGRATA